MIRDWSAGLVLVAALFSSAVVRADGIVIVVPDTTPDAFSFPAVDGVVPGVTVTTAPVTLAGFNVPLMLRVENGGVDIGCDGSFERLRPRDGAFYVTAGTPVCLRQMAPLACGASTTTVLHVGDASAEYTITTRTVEEGCVNPPSAAVASPESDSVGFSPWLVLAGLLLACRRQRPRAPAGRA